MSKPVPKAVSEYMANLARMKKGRPLTEEHKQKLRESYQKRVQKQKDQS